MNMNQTTAFKDVSKMTLDQILAEIMELSEKTEMVCRNRLILLKDYLDACVRTTRYALSVGLKLKVKGSRPKNRTTRKPKA